jgi:hypothetical protein
MPDDGTPPPGIGHNSWVEWTPEDMLGYVSQLGDVDVEIDVLKSRRKKLRKSAKALSIPLDIVDKAIKLAGSDRDAADHFLANLIASLRTLRVTIKSVEPRQHNLPLTDDNAVLKEAVLNAECQGFNAGLHDNPESENPHDPNTPVGQAWLRSWHDGYKARRHQMAPFKDDDDGDGDEDDTDDD